MNFHFPSFNLLLTSRHSHKHLSHPNLRVIAMSVLNIPEGYIYYRLCIQALLTIEPMQVHLYLRVEGHRVGGGCPFLPFSHTRGVEPSAPSHHASLYDLTSAEFSVISPRILRTVTRKRIIRSSLVSFLFISSRVSYHQQSLWVLLRLPATTQTTM